MNASMAHIHGGREKNPPWDLSRKKVRTFPRAERGAVLASTPARRRSGGLGLCEGAAAVAFRAEEVRRQGWCGEEEGSPAPLFIGEAW